jgi:hypothetical protein
MYRPVLLGQVYRPDCPPRHSWELNPRRPGNRVAAPAAGGGVPAPGGPALPPPPKKHGFKHRPERSVPGVLKQIWKVGKVGKVGKIGKVGKVGREDR